MKKILAINHEIIILGAIVIPTILFAFSVNIHSDGIVNYIWPFVFIYTVEKVTPFILDARLNLSAWSGATKLCSSIALLGALMASFACYVHIESISSLSAILIGFGVMGLKLLGDPNEKISSINFKKIKILSGICAAIIVGIFGFLLMKVSLLLGFIFYTLLLSLEVLYSFTIANFERNKLDLRISFKFRNTFVLTAVLCVVFIISHFKKMDKLQTFVGF